MNTVVSLTFFGASTFGVVQNIGQNTHSFEDIPFCEYKLLLFSWICTKAKLQNLVLKIYL